VTWHGRRHPLRQVKLLPSGRGRPRRPLRQVNLLQRIGAGCTASRRPSAASPTGTATRRAARTAASGSGAAPVRRAAGRVKRSTPVSYAATGSSKGAAWPAAYSSAKTPTCCGWWGRRPGRAGTAARSSSGSAPPPASVRPGAAWRRTGRRTGDDGTAGASWRGTARHGAGPAFFGVPTLFYLHLYSHEPLRVPCHEEHIWHLPVDPSPVRPRQCKGALLSGECPRRFLRGQQVARRSQ
jgi:hypothetical protein